MEKFGAIAVNGGMLSIKQVMKVFEMQADELDTPFGEIAVRLGFLSRRELADIDTEQSTDVPGFGPILVEFGVLTERRMLEELRSFIIVMVR